MSATAAQNRVRRWGPATSHLVRRLILSAAPPNQATLARDLHVSQPRISQIFHLLTKHGVAIDRLDDGEQRRRLIDLYVRYHRPFVASETLLYGLDPPYEQVRHVVDAARAQRAQVAVSADLAPDLVAPWRAPTLTVIYTDRLLEFEASTFVPAKARGESTILLRQVTDHALLESWVVRSELPLAHPVQQIWDLYDLGGEDRAEAAEHLIHVVQD